MQQGFKSSLVPGVLEEYILASNEEVEASCGAVEKHAPVVVYRFRYRARAGGPNADAVLTYPVILCKCTLLPKVGKKSRNP